MSGMAQENHCIILAGGLGTRLKSVLPDTPKCLAPIGESTFLEKQILFLKEMGVTHFTLSLGYGHKLVIEEMERLQQRHSLNIGCVVETHQLGTGGAIFNAMSTCALSETLVVNGDTFLDGDLKDMLLPLHPIEDHEELVRIALVKVQDSARFGGVNFKNGRILSFVEKGGSCTSIVSAGMYRLSSKIFDSRVVGSNFSLENEIFPEYVRIGGVSGCIIDGRFIDIGVPEDYFKFCEMQIPH